MALSLDSFRLLGRSGLRVSPLALGTMTFGESWGADEAESRRMFEPTSIAAAISSIPRATTLKAARRN